MADTPKPSSNKTAVVVIVVLAIAILALGGIVGMLVASFVNASGDEPRAEIRTEEVDIIPATEPEPGEEPEATTEVSPVITGNTINVTIENAVTVDMPIDISTMRGDGVYFISTEDEFAVTRISLGDGDMQTTIVPYDLRRARVRAFHVTEDGNFQFFAHMSGEYILLLYNPVADVMDYTVMTDNLFFDSGRQSVRYAEFTREGNLFVTIRQGDMEKGDNALLFDKDGNLLREIDLDNYFISDMAQAADGQLFLRGWPAGAEEGEIYEKGEIFFWGISRGIDPQTGVLTDTVLLENFRPRGSTWVSRFYSVASGGAFDLYIDVVINDTHILHGITLETGEMTPLLDWAELEIGPSQLGQAVYFSPNDQIATFQFQVCSDYGFWRELVILSFQGEI